MEAYQHNEFNQNGAQTTKGIVAGILGVLANFNNPT
jgi:L-serine deaminase